MVTKSGPSKVRGNYRRSEPKRLEDGLLFSKQLLTPEAIERGVRVMRLSGPTPEKEGGRRAKRESRRYVLRIIPAVCEETAAKVLPTFLEDNDSGNPVFGPWYENVTLARFGTGAARNQCILYDPASDAYQQARPEAINPYIILYRTCNISQGQFSDLVPDRDAEIGKPAAAIMLQAYLCYETEHGVIDVEKTLASPPTLIEAPFMAGAAILREFKNCLTRKTAKDNGEEVPESVGPGVATVNPLSLAKGVFVEVTVSPSETNSTWSDYSVKLIRAYRDTAGEPLSATFNGRLTEEVAIDRWQWWSDTLRWPSHAELAESIVHHLRHNPKAMAAIQLAWDSSDENIFGLLSSPLAEVVRQGAQKYHDELLAETRTASTAKRRDELPDEDDIFSAPASSKKRTNPSSSRGSGVQSKSRAAADEDGDDIFTNGVANNGQSSKVGDLADEDQEALEGLHGGRVPNDVQEADDLGDEEGFDASFTLEEDEPLDLSSTVDDDDDDEAAAPPPSSAQKKKTRKASSKKSKS